MEPSAATVEVAVAAGHISVVGIETTVGLGILVGFAISMGTEIATERLGIPEAWPTAGLGISVTEEPD